MIYSIIEILFQRGNDLAALLVEKIIKYERNDDHCVIVEYLLNYTLDKRKDSQTTEELKAEFPVNQEFIFNFESSFIMAMIDEANGHELEKIAS